MDIKIKIGDLRQMLIAHQTEIGYSIYDEILDILYVLNRRQQQNSDLLIKHEYGEPQEELKPCPFCGLENMSFHIGNGNDNYCWCRSCGARSTYCPSKEESIKAWNRRSNA